MSFNPQTPNHRPTSSHRRHPSSLDMAYRTPSRRQSINRRSSGYSPVTPRLSREFEHDSPAHNFDGGGDGGGLGNLADELGEIGEGWDSEMEGVEDDYGHDLDAQEHDANQVGMAVEHDGSSGVDHTAGANGVRDSGVAMSPTPSTVSRAALSPSGATKSRRHARQRSLYDGSDFGEDSDLDNGEVSQAMERTLADVEGLARKGLGEDGSESDTLIKRVTEQLRELGSQTAIENGATRLKTTHDALATHVTHQSRTLTSLTASFSGPRPIALDIDDIEALIPLVASTVDLLPHSSTDPLLSISQLNGQTRDLVHQLNSIQDVLHMIQQDAKGALRSLRTCEKHVLGWRRENEMADAGHAYLKSGDWDRRIREREAKDACANVLEGFEAACGGWREKLCDGLGVATQAKTFTGKLMAKMQSLARERT